MSADGLREYAREWVSVLDDASPEDPLIESVVLMGFIAPADQQWQFLVAAVDAAKSDDHLGHVAAGPAECLLGRHGDECMTWFEGRAAEDPVFARMLTGVWQYTMSDEIWARVQALQARVEVPLVLSDDDSAPKRE